MSGQDSSRRPRARNVKRTVVLLRNNDELRVPGKQKLKNLQDSGRIKEIDFSNNATSEHIGEILLNSFANFLTQADLRRWDFDLIVSFTPWNVNENRVQFLPDVRIIHCENDYIFQ